jgi:hypothetical protein
LLELRLRQDASLDKELADALRHDEPMVCHRRRVTRNLHAITREKRPENAPAAWSPARRFAW